MASSSVTIRTATAVAGLETDPGAKALARYLIPSGLGGRERVLEIYRRINMATFGCTESVHLFRDVISKMVPTSSDEYHGASEAISDSFNAMIHPYICYEIYSSEKELDTEDLEEAYSVLESTCGAVMWLLCRNNVLSLVDKYGRDDDSDEVYVDVKIFRPTDSFNRAASFFSLVEFMEHVLSDQYPELGEKDCSDIAFVTTNLKAGKAKELIQPEDIDPHVIAEAVARASVYVRVMLLGWSQEEEVAAEWFKYIASGAKTIEVRLYKKRWTMIAPGQVITWVCGSSGAKIKRVVSKVERYTSFRECLSVEGLARTLPGIKTLEEGVNVYWKYYDKRCEETYGVVAIGLV
jgi:ASC-1-like (ASCH) protein